MHPTGPQSSVGGHIAGYGIFFSIGTAVIDPAIVRDQWQTELFLKPVQSI
jgi:hypothetical protein